MDYVVCFMWSRKQFNSTWIIGDRMTNSNHLLPVRTNFSSEDYSKLFIKEIVKLHGTQISIISDSVLSSHLTFRVLF